ncbi:MAG: CoA-transferase subunit beta [Acidimicrobiia bacterium]|jgi:glutaconate CoA-transferase subunit B|nr:CoA-transferase subunit beta [Acidimicrobiia bacterium]
MVVAAARRLAGERMCFVGIGLPNLACSLAQRTVEPSLELVYESGAVGSRPERLPISIGDPCLVAGARAVASQYDLFAFYLQGGRVDVAFLGAAQIDRNGSINTTVIGPYAQPKVRLPGSGGACEIALLARKVFVIVSQSARSFVPRLDFVTSPGHVPGRQATGGGPDTVITQLGIYRFVAGEMTLTALHPGATVEEARAACGWDLAVAADLEETPPPTEAELAELRALDPERVYL